jgi:hypothetical protein
MTRRARIVELWGAHAPRVLVLAPRRNELLGLKGKMRDFERTVKSSRWRGRHRQHTRRVRSPDISFRALLIVVN